VIAIEERVCFLLLTILGAAGMLAVFVLSHERETLPTLHLAFLTLAGALAAGSFLLGLVLLSITPTQLDDEFGPHPKLFVNSEQKDY
jgi:hypothetical protein